MVSKVKDVMTLMLSGKEKIYFLLNRIDDARTITPAGQPLIIDPTNNLNQNYRDIELAQLFTKLAKDEQILKILKAPSRTKEIDIVEDLDPYEYADDGCWHIELLPAFNAYYNKIQSEPEYQEWSPSRKPASSPAKLSSDSLMTYEEKLDLIVRAVLEASKTTRKRVFTATLYLNATNGLDRLPREEINNILLQLQDEKALKVHPLNNRLLPPNQQPTHYFLLDIPEFDSWYGNYLMRQKSKPANLDWLNLLKVLDVCSDIDQQLQVMENATVVIPSFPYPYIGRFLELFPYDSIGTRKSYQQHRWEGAQYLLKRGIALEARYDRDDASGYGDIEIKVDPVRFDEFYRAIQDEFEKRQKSADKKEEKPKTIDKAKVTPKVTYNAQKGELDIEDKKVKFKKDSFRVKLLELLLKDDKSRKKEWSCDEVIETIEGITDLDLLKEKQKKFYPACDGLSKFVAQKTGVNDLLIYTKSTAQINPKYF